MSVTPPVIRHEVWGDAAERVHLFSIVRSVEGAEDSVVEYSMPKAENGGLALGYLKRARHEGEDLAGSWLLEEVLGAAGYDALAGEPGVTLATIRQVAKAATAVAFGRTIPEPEGADPFGQAQ